MSESCSLCRSYCTRTQLEGKSKSHDHCVPANEIKAFPSCIPARTTEAVSGILSPEYHVSVAV
jgi:hypothetical protein